MAQGASDILHANVKWISGEEFEPRPLNKSGAARVELVRTKGGKIHFLATFDNSNGVFTDFETGVDYARGSVEVRDTLIE